LKLLITGGLGFIGSNLVDSLTKKNHKIKILTKTFSKKDNIKNSRNKVEIEKIDLTNFKRLGYIIEKFKPDVIIHLAGNTSHSKSFEKPLDDIDEIIFSFQIQEDTSLDYEHVQSDPPVFCPCVNLHGMSIC